MEIEYDPAKDALNQNKHGVPLAFGSRIFEDADHLLLGSHRPEDGEARWKVIGRVNERLWTAIFVRRKRAVRFISVRKSNDGEAKAYDRD